CYSSWLLCPLPSPFLPYTTLFRSSVIILGTSLGLAPIGQTGGQLLDMNRPLLGIDGSRCGGTVPGGIDLARQSVAMELKDRCDGDRKSTRLNSSHVKISYAVFCLK